MSLEYHYNGNSFHTWEEFKAEIGKSISKKEFLLLCQTDSNFLEWLYPQSSYYNYEEVGQYLSSDFSVSDWADIFTEKSPVTVEMLLKEMFGEELFSDLEKINEEQKRVRLEEELEKMREHGEEELEAYFRPMCYTPSHFEDDDDDDDDDDEEDEDL